MQNSIMIIIIIIIILFSDMTYVYSPSPLSFYLIVLFSENQWIMQGRYKHIQKLGGKLRR